MNKNLLIVLVLGTVIALAGISFGLNSVFAVAISFVIAPFLFLISGLAKDRISERG